jgi:hypothetical protein
MDLAENIVRPICVDEMDNQTHHVENSLIRGEEMCNKCMQILSADDRGVIHVLFVTI